MSRVKVIGIREDKIVYATMVPAPFPRPNDVGGLKKKWY